MYCNGNSYKMLMMKKYRRTEDYGRFLERVKYPKAIKYWCLDMNWTKEPFFKERRISKDTEYVDFKQKGHGLRWPTVWVLCEEQLAAEMWAGNIDIDVGGTLWRDLNVMLMS